MDKQPTPHHLQTLMAAYQHQLVGQGQPKPDKEEHPPQPFAQWPLLGTQFLYAFDFCNMHLTYLSESFWLLTGHPQQEPSLQMIYEHLHPEDHPEVLRATLLLANFALNHAALIQPLEHVFSIDYRIRKADGTYLRVLRQTSVLEKTAAGAIASCVSVCTDITGQKKTTDLHFSMNLPEFEQYVEKAAETVLPVRLSQREEQILKLIMAGKKTRDIAAALNLSAFTVDTHRKNMKKKLNFHNTAELVGFAYTKGL